MLSEHSSDVKFEIGHVLFIDIVGNSKLLVTEQSERIQTLKEIVRGTEPASIVWQDDLTMAFMDRRQFHAGHTLVIPRQHLL